MSVPCGTPVLIVFLPFFAGSETRFLETKLLFAGTRTEAGVDPVFRTEAGVDVMFLFQDDYNKLPCV